jgi:hypothetical protein
MYIVLNDYNAVVTVTAYNEEEHKDIIVKFETIIRIK